MSGPELASRMKIGTRVMRGIDWKWGDQVGYIHMSHDTYIHTHLDTKWPAEIYIYICMYCLKQV